MASDTTVRLDSVDSPTVRFDATGTLANARKNPQGGFLVDASITRPGIFVYPDGVDYRPPEEVYKADSLATLEGAPVTLLHPPASDNRGLINPANFSKYAKGVATHAKADTAKGEIGSTLSLQDARLIEAVEAGTREVSCGYVCKYDMTPGTTPDGTKYDRVQRDIRYNHIAVVPTGRAGESGGKTVIRLDSAGNELPPEYATVRLDVHRPDADGREYTADYHRQEAYRHETASTDHRRLAERHRAAGRTKLAERHERMAAHEHSLALISQEAKENEVANDNEARDQERAAQQTGERGGTFTLTKSGNKDYHKRDEAMFTIKIDGVDYPLATPAECQAAIRAQSAYAAKLDAAEATRVVKASETQAKLDAAEARVVSLTKELTEAKDPAKLDAAISARTSLAAKAVEILGKDEAAKLDHGALRTAIIAKVFPTVKLDGKDSAYIDAMYDAAIATPRLDASGNSVIANALGTKPAPVVEAKLDAAPVKRPHEMPLAYSKDK